MLSWHFDVLYQMLKFMEVILSPSLFSPIKNPISVNDGQEAITMKDHRALEDLKIKYQAELERIESDLAQSCQQAITLVKTSDPDEIAKIIATQEAEYQKKWTNFSQNVASVKQEVEAINAKFSPQAMLTKDSGVF